MPIDFDCALNSWSPPPPLLISLSQIPFPASSTDGVTRRSSVENPLSRFSNDTAIGLVARATTKSPEYSIQSDGSTAVRRFEPLHARDVRCQLEGGLGQRRAERGVAGPFGHFRCTRTSLLGGENGGFDEML